MLALLAVVRIAALLAILDVLGTAAGAKMATPGTPSPAKPTAAATSARMGTGLPAFNAADVPDRCGPESLGSYEEIAWDPAKTASTPLADFVTQILGRDPSVRIMNLQLQYDIAKMDYFRKRREAQAEFERQIAAAPSDHQMAQLDNYAWFLAFTGEFEKILEYFPGQLEARPDDRSIAHGSVLLAIAQAQFRLGRYADSAATARRAVDLVTDTPDDVRWQLMMSELALYGPDFFDKYSKDVYSAENIPTWYPKKDWELPFEDVSDTVGKNIARVGASGAVNFVDFDGDGWDDLFLERKYFPPMLYRNVQGKSFEPVAGAVPNDCANLLSPVADYDNDGRLDMFRTCCNFDGSGPLRLLRGQAGLRFADQSAQTIFRKEKQCGMPPVWLDWDLDGDVDLFAPSFCGPSQAYRNDGNGQFTNVTEQAGIHTPGSTLLYKGLPEFGAVGAAAGYFFGGPYPDIYVQGYGWRQMYRNNGDGTFTESLATTGLDQGKDKTFFLAFGFDYNNDGKEDILASSYPVPGGIGPGPKCSCSNLLRPDSFSRSETDGAASILENLGNGKFRDIRDKARFIPFGVMGISHGDWNNDGFEDVVLGVGGPAMQQSETVIFLQNDGGTGSFTNMTPFTMLPLWGKIHGVAFADYDHDGQLDVMLNNGGMMPGDLSTSMLLRNTGTGSHWIAIALEADPKAGTNAAAIGARVWVKTKSGRQLRTLFGGTFGTNSLTSHFGLGADAEVEEIVVEWPNKAGAKTVLKNVPGDQAIAVSQATGKHRTLWSKPAAAGGRATKS